jgi:hypothetical protein
MSLVALVSLMGVLTVVAVYFWWGRKSEAHPAAAHPGHERRP